MCVYNCVYVCVHKKHRDVCPRSTCAYLRVCVHVRDDVKFACVCLGIHVYMRVCENGRGDVASVCVLYTARKSS